MRKTIIEQPTVASCAFERCTTPARDNGWCDRHEYAAQLLRTAREYGCPRLERECLIIGRGLGSWEVYCVRVSKGHAREIENELREQYGKGRETTVIENVWKHTRMYAAFIHWSVAHSSQSVDHAPVSHVQRLMEKGSVKQPHKSVYRSFAPLEPGAVICPARTIHGRSRAMC